MAPAGLTFEELVDQRSRNEDNAAASAFIGFGRAANPGDLGPYEPVIAYLDDRATAWTPEFAAEVRVPKRTRSVETSAAKLDRALDDGLCPARPR